MTRTVSATRGSTARNHRTDRARPARCGVSPAYHSAATVRARPGGPPGPAVTPPWQRASWL
eukprot:763367-Hanusia_phi.AAC.1